MAPRSISPLIQLLRKSVARRNIDALSDAHLLERFAFQRDASAFEMLVQRFGPMVFGVCRRILGDIHAAEDAFQATFLVLAQKAPSLLHRSLVGNWLYGVAYRTAKRAKTDAARRHSQERQAPMASRSDPLEEVVWRDLRPVLDEEIHDLPAKYRRPFVLCYLEGRTNEEAARELGWPVGTLFTRLARARELLRHRLTRRGIGLSGFSLTALLTSEATAAVSASLSEDIVRAATLFAAGNAAASVVSAHAATLAEGVLHAMFLSKLKTTGVVLMVVVALGSAGVVCGRQVLDRDRARIDSERPPAVLPNERANAELAGKVRDGGPQAETEAKSNEETQLPPAQDKEGSGFGIGIGSGSGGGWGAGFGSGAGFGMGSGSSSGYASHKLTALVQKPVQRELKLTDEQQKKVRSLEAKHQRDLRRLMPQNPFAAFNDPAGTMQTMRDAPAKMQKLGKEVDEAIDSTLTAAQGRRLGEISLQLRGGHALSDPEVAKALKLTRDQMAKLQEIQQEAMKEMQKIGLRAMGDAFRGGPNPAAFQKTSGQVAKKMKEVWNGLGDRLLEVLTSEQKAEWQKLTGEPFRSTGGGQSRSRR